MTARTFTTDLKTPSKKISKWLFIAGGCFLVITQSYNYLVTFDEIYLLGLAIGIWILLQGLFFKQYLKKYELKIGNKSIRYHRAKTFSKPERTTVVYTKEIRKITLSNYSISIELKDKTARKLRLDRYSRHQFVSIKEQLEKIANTTGAHFDTRYWWKNKRFLKTRRNMKQPSEFTAKAVSPSPPKDKKS